MKYIDIPSTSIDRHPPCRPDWLQAPGPNHTAPSDIVGDTGARVIWERAQLALGRRAGAAHSGGLTVSPRGFQIRTRGSGLHRALTSLDVVTLFASLFVWTNVSPAHVSKLCSSSKDPSTDVCSCGFCQQTNIRAGTPSLLVPSAPVSRTQRSDNVRHRLAQLRYQLPHARQTPAEGRTSWLRHIGKISRCTSFEILLCSCSPLCLVCVSKTHRYTRCRLQALRARWFLHSLVRSKLLERSGARSQD